MSNSNSNNKFSSRIGFIAAASGAAIGLGNIWKFPYEVGSNGGAAFLIIYLIFTIIVGYPIVLTKIAFGKSTNKGLYHIYKTEGKWQIQGFAPALLCLILFSFYSIVTSWILGYSFKTITGSLFTETNMEQYFNKFISNVPNVLFLTLLINIIIAFIVSAGIKKGVELSSKILMPIFILLVISLITYGLYLENSIEGVKFYLLPNFSLITKKSIIMALSHSFFSLTIGASVMIIYGSYIKGKVNLINDAALIVTSDVFVAFLAGLLIFPFIFHQGIKPDQGASLIFITLPTIFKTLGPITGVILGFSFFLLLIFAAVTSAIPMMEVTINYIMNKWQLSRKKERRNIHFNRVYFKYSQYLIKWWK